MIAPPLADALEALERRLDRAFSDRALLTEALTHRSALEPRGGPSRSYERLEFLGDRVLGMVIAQRLYQTYPDAGENEMAPRFNALVNRKACAEAARRAELGPCLILAASEEADGGREKDAILADACEALIAALYLEGGLEAARDFVWRFWGDAFENARSVRKDAKTLLQEWAAARKWALSYELVDRSGPEHAPRFVVRARVGDTAPAQGEGGSKRAAEQAAAAAYIAMAGIDG